MEEELLGETAFRREGQRGKGGATKKKEGGTMNIKGGGLIKKTLPVVES